MKSYGTIEHVADGARPEWRITTAPHVMIKLKRLFPRLDQQRTGAATLVDTPEVSRDLAWVLERWPHQVSRRDRGVLNRRASEQLHTELAIERILAGERPELDGAHVWMAEERDYQLEAAALCLATGRLLLTDEYGLGKSHTGLLLFRDPRTLPALVVTLTDLPLQWLEFLQGALPLLRAHILRKGTPYDIAATREMRGHEPDVIITNYAKLAGWADALAGKVRTVIYDEAQELRRTDSQRYKAATLIAEKADFKLGMTATPIYNYGGEVHNVVSVLDEDVLGSRPEFVREWGVAMANGHVRVSEPGTLSSYLRDVGVMLRRTRKEVGRELPPLIPVEHRVDVDHDTLEKLSGDALDLAELILSEDPDRRRDVWQASGDFDWRMRHATGLAKAPYVAEFVRLLLEADEHVVLYGWHHDVYELWGDRLSDYAPAFFTGRESAFEKKWAKARFLGGDHLADFVASNRATLSARVERDSWRLDYPEHFETKLLTMSLRAGAGLDGLQDAAHIAVFGELDWSPKVHGQCIGRLRRDGQTEPTLAYFLVADHGADPVMAEVLDVKQMQADQFDNPDGELFEQTPATVDHVRRLAEDLVRRRHGDQTRLEAA